MIEVNPPSAPCRLRPVRRRTAARGSSPLRVPYRSGSWLAIDPLLSRRNRQHVMGEESPKVGPSRTRGSLPESADAHRQTRGPDLRGFDHSTYWGGFGLQPRRTESARSSPHALPADLESSCSRRDHVVFGLFGSARSLRSALNYRPYPLINRRGLTVDVVVDLLTLGPCLLIVILRVAI